MDSNNTHGNIWTLFHSFADSISQKLNSQGNNPCEANILNSEETSPILNIQNDDSIITNVKY
jgi:hypothetical protein